MGHRSPPEPEVRAFLQPRAKSLMHHPGLRLLLKTEHSAHKNPAAGILMGKLQSCGFLPGLLPT